MDGAVFPHPQLFNLRPNYGGGNKDNGHLLQNVLAPTAALSDPNPVADHRQLMPPPDTHRQVGLSLVGSLLLSPGSWCAQGFVCVLQESFPSPM